MNRCTFIGRLTRDPELRSTSSGKSVVNFAIAVDDEYKKDAPPAFVDLEAWDTAAETIEKYFKKGDPIVIQDATFRLEEWQDKDGNKRRTPRFRCNRFSFVPRTKDRTDGEQAEAGETTKRTRKKAEAPETRSDEEIPF